MSKSIQILLVDDHDLVREGLKALLTAQPDLEIIGDVSSGEAALEFVKDIQPDVILMDIMLEGMTGLEATKQLKDCCPQAKVLALTIHEGQDYFFSMLQAGASGYVPKRAASEDLIQAIRVIAEGDVYLHPSVAGALVQDFLQEGKATEEAPVDISDKITAREREVLVLIGEGLRNQDIAEQLSISPKTVSRHRENILRKLNLETRADLIRYALEMGLID